MTTHVYFVDLKNVCNLLEFRDFNRWLLPLKGEQLPQNSWVLLIPALQLLLCTAVACVSCCITCGFTDAVDIVLNSLAFTFIAKVCPRPCTRHAHAMHMPCMCHAHAMHMPCTCHAQQPRLHFHRQGGRGPQRAHLHPLTPLRLHPLTPSAYTPHPLRPHPLHP